MIEIAGSPRKFGRKVEHDPRSRAYGVAVNPAEEPVSILWTNRAPVLDQGDLGSCTGNAMAQWENVVRTAAGACDWLDETIAIELYSEATRLDEFNGEYAPDDTGSSGLAVAKAAVARGYISSYRHAFGLTQTLLALKHSPVTVGTVWLSDMNEPDESNMLHASGESLGGHQYLLVGCDVDNEFVTILNSWSSNWGDNGTARISFSDMQMLLDQQGDVVVPIS
ncbi:peptidase [Gordonia phage GMA2]|uniref:Putative lysin n=1 Tax=Gordonia phage GMA2 TaxID=1647283 RepID=A0A0K0N7E2_9CAUD|nr:peptidase [Gordonia phage GMA2]AKJ72576.1 putative lysin [Gordonia phage GMA2]